MESSKRSSAMAFFVGGLLPVIAFTVIEETYGTMAGLIAGMVFGLGEIAFELYKYKKVEAITWIGNGLIIILGVASIYLNDGIWFKLQPAIFEIFFVIMLWGSFLFKKPLLILLAEKQKQEIPEVTKPYMAGMTFRLGIFFLIHAGLAVWAAFSWSTTNWALLKGLGLTISFVLYLFLEVLYIRSSIKKN